MELSTSYENLGFSNNFMFGKIMGNPNRARRFLEQILGIKIHHIEYIEREKVVDEKFDGRSIRMDIYVDDGTTIYNCEMQTTDERNLPKRSRFYQSQIDINFLNKGENFRNLKQSYVIFICTFDPFKSGRRIYTFENVCLEDKSISLDDRTTKVFVNTKGSLGNETESFKELLEFIDTSVDRVYENQLANDLLADLKTARSNMEWRHDYMTWKTLQDDCRWEGREEGLKEGREEGILSVIKQFLFNGGTDEMAKKMLGATDEQIARAKALK